MEPSRLDSALVDLRATLSALARSAGELRVQAARCERHAMQLQRAGELGRRALHDLEGLRAEEREAQRPTR